MFPPGLVLIPLQQEFVRREGIQTAVRMILVVLLAPTLHHPLGFCQAAKDLPVQAFRPQLLVEAFSVGVLPGTAGRDVFRLHLLGGQEELHSAGDELRTVVRAEIARCTTRPKQALDGIDHSGCRQGTSHPNGQGLLAEFVDDDENLQTSALFRPVEEKIVGPDVMGRRGLEGKGGGEVGPFSGFPSSQGQSFLFPQTVDPFPV